MKVVVVGFFLLCFFLQGVCQNVVDAYFLTTIPKASLNYIPGLTPEYDVHAYYVLYSTVDGRGDSTVASGLCLVPDTDTCNFFPLISYQHGTIMKKSDVPSRLNGESLIGQIFCSLGNITLCPDYIGLGDSPGLHPYCHAQSEATATVDFIRAARQFLNDSLQMYDNGQVFLTGYSQGGHATMAAHKYIEDNNLLSEIQVVASAPCSGPYDISGAQAEMIFNTPDYGSPAYLVYILFAYNDVYQNIFSIPSDVLKTPYDITIPPYLNGNFSHSQMNNALPDSLHLFLDDIFYQSVIDDMDDKLTPFWQDLVDNDVFNWSPVVPVRMYYCQADEQVSYLNSVNAFNAMQNAGASDVQAINVNASAGHGDCGLPAIVNAYYWFNTKRIPCYGSASLNVYSETRYRLYPNPASHMIYVDGFEDSYSLICVDMNGKIVARWVDSKSGVSISDIPSGLYVFQLINNENISVYWSKVLVIQ